MNYKHDLHLTLICVYTQRFVSAQTERGALERAKRGKPQIVFISDPQTLRQTNQEATEMRTRDFMNKKESERKGGASTRRITRERDR